MTITVGLAGAGRRAVRVHAPALSSAPEIRFAGIWALSPGPARALAGRFGVPAFRERGVLLERPMAGDLAGAEELAKAVRERNVVSQMGLAWRYAAEVRRVLRDHGVDLLDLLEATLGPIADVRAHGNQHGWIGLMLDHLGGHYSEASMSATVPRDVFRADVEVFGPGGVAALDCIDVVGPAAYRTMYAEFAAAVEQQMAPALDVEHGLHLQRVIESADTGIVFGA